MTDENDGRTAEERFEAGRRRAEAWYARQARPNPVTNRLGGPFAGPIATKGDGE